MTTTAKHSAALPQKLVLDFFEKIWHSPHQLEGIDQLMMKDFLNVGLKEAPPNYIKISFQEIKKMILFDNLSEKSMLNIEITELIKIQSIMKNLLKSLILMGILTAPHIQAQKIKTLTGFHHIESVATDGRFLYAADIGKELNPTAKDGDGKIIKLDKRGNILQASLLQEKLNAPKGLAINKGVLYLNDIDRLIAFDLKSGNKLYEIDLSKDTSFLNDIAVWDNTTLYVSATDKNKLFKVNLTDKSYTEVKTDKTIFGINGLFCYKNANRIYVNGMGAENKANGIIGYINLKDNTFTRITQLEGLYDGIYISNDVLYVSNWVAFEKKGIIQGIGIYGSNRIETINPSEPISGPADFTILDDVMFIPAMISGEIHFITLNRDLYLKL